MQRRLPFILLAAILVLSFGLNARMAADPRDDYQSADERSYGKLAVDIADNHHYGSPSTKMREPLHWPPGAPLVFAAGYELFGSAQDAQDYDIGAVYWQQAVITTGTTALAAALAWILVGPWAGVLAALLVGTYPPLIGATGDQLSEPLGAFLLLGAFVALALAVKRNAPLAFAAAGALFGLTILTRTDLLAVPFLIAGIGGAIVLFKERSLKRAILRWGMVAIAAALVLAPWTIYASREAGRRDPGHEGQRGRAVRRHLPPGRGHDDRDEGAPRGRVAPPPPVL